ncbi:hypothetical protein AOQ84DRAFT_367617 [Glonium stellatum]|uniref:Uncharacterized protein n=1 Tax=Glonium stellatum TaxID=574774 RepID=A0A8E2ETJ1_9PEZI|nr:hypothetical protein AOQ84DRAFT_367617 [Glonium stellatum]
MAATAPTAATKVPLDLCPHWSQRGQGMGRSNGARAAGAARAAKAARAAIRSIRSHQLLPRLPTNDRQLPPATTSYHQLLPSYHPATTSNHHLLPSPRAPRAAFGSVADSNETRFVISTSWPTGPPLPARRPKGGKPTPAAPRANQRQGADAGVDGDALGARHQDTSAPEEGTKEHQAIRAPGPSPSLSLSLSVPRTALSHPHRRCSSTAAAAAPAPQHQHRQAPASTSASASSGTSICPHTSAVNLHISHPASRIWRFTQPKVPGDRWPVAAERGV